jgi:hypothetical protein
LGKVSSEGPFFGASRSYGLGSFGGHPSEAHVSPPSNSPPANAPRGPRAGNTPPRGPQGGSGFAGRPIATPRGRGRGSFGRHHLATPANVGAPPPFTPRGGFGATETRGGYAGMHNSSSPASVGFADRARSRDRFGATPPVYKHTLKFAIERYFRPVTPCPVVENTDIPPSTGMVKTDTFCLHCGGFLWVDGQFVHLLYDDRNMPYCPCQCRWCKDKIDHRGRVSIHVVLICHLLIYYSCVQVCGYPRLSTKITAPARWCNLIFRYAHRLSIAIRSNKTSLT